MHPMGNGRAEKFVQDITRILSHIVLQCNLEAKINPPDLTIWPKCLDTALYTYLNHVARTTGISQYNVVFGQHCHILGQSTTGILDPEALNTLLTADYRADRDILRACALENANNNRLTETAAINAKRKPPGKYAVGAWVYIHRSKLDTTYVSSRKLVNRWTGPYQVSKAYPGGAYLLLDEHGCPAFNSRPVNHLRMVPARVRPAWHVPAFNAPYNTPLHDNQEDPPPPNARPEEIDNDSLSDVPELVPDNLQVSLAVLSEALPSDDISSYPSERPVDHRPTLDDRPLRACVTQCPVRPRC
ncbi:uncharacterized protein EV422DRAFT_569224 [Fimicolochytrium jonesii]|uniref:uncharacterized protein n=1 Tax=Fimicolochytrium jonesii TaxID=1396493 RepID=UPI0022FE8ACA|nr:uncharacterized protein EV422DRAFT_569224 [Fimicolochytrium jonesii]KAI8818946.1 hypothetical protein EV422DRAFT_569224 [Fimicolochytrium jonesii]